jgi:hypothetical protein
MVEQSITALFEQSTAQSGPVTGSIQGGIGHNLAYVGSDVRAIALDASR